jgi:carbon storage regulator
MLFITRKECEGLFIDGIEVRIVKVEGNCVRIGVKAPPSVSVHRYEIYEKIVSANQASVHSKVPQIDASKVLGARLLKPSSDPATPPSSDDQ